MSQIFHLTLLSKWVRTQKNVTLNDFPVFSFDVQKRFKVYDHVLKNYDKGGAINYMEFGVAGGSSIKWWINNNTHPDSRFYGYDTFTGLPEAWGMYVAGDMGQGGNLPDVNNDARVTFVKGLFQETLPGFLEKFEDNKPKVIHLDADLYSATLYVLTKMHHLLKPGDILIFDEFNVPNHEYKAYLNFTESYYFKSELVAAQNNYFYTAIKVL